MLRTLTLIALAQLTVAPAAAAQGAPPLGLHGLEPGMSQALLADRVAKLGGRLGCRGSTVDKRLGDCSASLGRAPDHRDWALRAALVGGVAAIVVVTTEVGERELDRMRDQMITELGRPNLRAQGPVRCYEWIRSGKMLRLTSNGTGSRREVSISLVDGAALDQLGGV